MNDVHAVVLFLYGDTRVKALVDQWIQFRVRQCRKPTLIIQREGDDLAQRAGHDHTLEIIYFEKEAS
jgi:hypothetical protein